MRYGYTSKTKVDSCHKSAKIIFFCHTPENSSTGLKGLKKPKSRLNEKKQIQLSE